ncbi:hypothetical protein V6N00_02350 [Tersicoccus sp. MR15.9]|uniref:hypothetical protein n=1 Tax=Tersicoccus mangrovi TaxID=3121635 RepID=UPI002FE5C9C8
MGQDPLENDRTGSRRPETTTPGSPGQASGGGGWTAFRSATGIGRGTAASSSPSSDAAPESGRVTGAGNGQDRRQRAVAGPFTVRDLTVLGSILVLLIGSVIPLFVDAGNGYTAYGNLWNVGATPQLVVFGLFLPLVVGGLFVARRLSGKDEVLRIGSLSLDQFASVVASVAAVFHFLSVVTFFQAGPIIALIGALGMLVATVGGPHIPGFSSDFVVRPSVEARLVARPAVPAYQAPRPVTPPSPAGSDRNASGANGPGTGTSAETGTSAVTGTSDSSGAGTATGSSAASGTSAGAGAAGAGAVIGAGTVGALVGRSAGSPREQESSDGDLTDDDTRVTSSSSTPSAPPSTTASGADRTVERDDDANGAAETDAADADVAVTAASGTDADDTRTTVVPTIGASGRGLDDDRHGDELSGDELGGDELARDRVDDHASHHDLADDASHGDVDDSDRGDRDDTVVRPAVTDEGTTRVGDTADEDHDMTAVRPAQWQTADAATADDADTVARPVGHDADPRTRPTELQDEPGADEQDVTRAGARVGASAVSAPIGAVVDPADERREDGGYDDVRDGSRDDRYGRDGGDRQDYEAFWFAVAYPRPVFEERTGRQAFQLEPGAWILALQDRGSSFLVQHTDGRVAVLHDLNSIERA